MRALALAGPTASGKTAAALALAEVLPLEIVSVDSALVYRGMDIGTAKPDAAQRARVPHHLIDIRDPREAYSAAEFAADAARLIDQINARGRLALLTGGTMLYLKALIEGLAPMPAADPALRRAIDREAAERGWPALHAELARVDPTTASRLAPGDAQRIQRALEVWRASGRPLSDWHAAGAAARTPLPALPLIALEPSDRAWLHERIAARFERMLEQGFLDEVRALRARGDLDPALPALRSVGYRQAWAALEEGRLGTLAERAIAATRQLAKRQLTWLRSMPERHVVACDAPDAIERVLGLAGRLVQGEPNVAPREGSARRSVERRTDSAPGAPADMGMNTDTDQDQDQDQESESESESDFESGSGSSVGLGSNRGPGADTDADNGTKADRDAEGVQHGPA